MTLKAATLMMPPAAHADDSIYYWLSTLIADLLIFSSLMPPLRQLADYAADYATASRRCHISLAIFILRLPAGFRHYAIGWH
jgi:hypothetical protein